MYELLYLKVWYMSDIWLKKERERKREKDINLMYENP